MARDPDTRNAAAGRRRHFFLANCCWQLVRSDDGARAAVR